MGLSFLAPFFLAGAALLAAPYLIHQIRRPEREPIRFSSVMFIPDVQKEVIERKRVQHILLMLLRMALLLLLAFAFARPYLPAMAEADTEAGPVRHAILLDTSYSMGADGVFERAKDAARDILDDIPDGEAVSVMTFAGRVNVAAPFATDRPGQDAASRAIDAAELTHESTAFIPALESAELLATSGAEEGSVTPLVLHVVSDFQKTGMPDQDQGWKLSPQTQLEVLAVGNDRAVNYAVTETHVRPTTGGGLRILGKIRNWSDIDADTLSVRLVVDGAEVETQRISVKARSARQVSFSLPEPRSGTLSGYIEVGADDLDTDNQRFFTWNPPRRSRVLLVADDRPEERWPPLWFFRQALPENASLPWEAEVAGPEDAAAALTGAAPKPNIVIVCDLNGLTEITAAALMDYARDGGQVLFALNDSIDADALNAMIFSGSGIAAGGPRHTKVRETQFDLLSWVDLEHPIFLAFQGTRFNDFSALRFFNHVKLQVGEGVRVLARYDNDAPAMVEMAIGQGRMIVWPFAVDLAWTNLPKNARFVPLLYETLTYLGGARDYTRDWQVGERVPFDAFAADRQGISLVQWPGGETPAELDSTGATSSQILHATRPGLLRSRAKDVEAWEQIDAVNVAPDEGDLMPLATSEFQLKVASAQVMRNDSATAGIVGTEIDEAGFLIDSEYGRSLIMIIFALVLVECVYMSMIKGQ